MEVDDIISYHGVALAHKKAVLLIGNHGACARWEVRAERRGQANAVTAAA
jgi:hypothetical protein